MICKQSDVTVVDAWTVMLRAHGPVTCEWSRTTASQLTTVLSVELSLNNACERKRFNTGAKQTESSAENVSMTGASKQLTRTIRTMYSRPLVSRYSHQTVFVSVRTKIGAKHHLKSANYNEGRFKSVDSREKTTKLSQCFIYLHLGHLLTVTVILKNLRIPLSEIRHTVTCLLATVMTIITTV